MVNFLLADMISRLKNAAQLKFSSTFVLQNKISYCSLIILKDLGYIRLFYLVNYKFIKVYLSYKKNLSTVRQFYIISKPSLKYYFKVRNYKGVQWVNFHLNNLFLFCTTSYKLLTSVESLMLHVGGEPLFAIL